MFALSAQSDQRDVPDGMVVCQAIAIRHARLVRLAEARAMRVARAQDRDTVEQGAYAATLQAREAKAQRTGRAPRGRPPTPPTPGPRVADYEQQYQ